MKIIVDSIAKWKSYIGDSESLSFSTLVDDFFGFLVLYNYIVPISLYVTIGESLFVFQNVLCQL